MRRSESPDPLSDTERIVHDFSILSSSPAARSARASSSAPASTRRTPSWRTRTSPSGADMVTVAVRRVNLTDRSKESLLDYIDRERIFILPNTAGCYTADDAIRTARLGREVGLSNWVKLEVIGDEQTLFPDNVALLEATRVLVAAKGSSCCRTRTTTR